MASYDAVTKTWPDTLHVASFGVIVPVDPVDVALPVVGDFDPEDGTEIGPGDSISFSVTDDSGAFARIMVIVSMNGIAEVVHDGAAFRGLFQGASSRSAITGGFRYTVGRQGGWEATPTFEVFAIDSSGNEAA